MKIAGSIEKSRAKELQYITKVSLAGYHYRKLGKSSRD